MSNQETAGERWQPRKKASSIGGMAHLVVTYKGKEYTQRAEEWFVDAIIADHEVLARATEALEMADSALGLAIMFMAGHYSGLGIEPEEYEKLEAFVKVNNPRLAIKAFLEALSSLNERSTADE